MNNDGTSFNPGLEIHRRRGALAALVLLCGMVGLMLHRNLAGIAQTGRGAAPAPVVIPAFPEPEPIEARYWHAMLPASGTVVAEAPIAQRYQLAGTYLAFTQGAAELAPAASTRIAVLDDLTEKKQVLVYEGRMVDDHKVVLVEENRAVLEGPGGRVELWRRVSGGAVPRATVVDPNEGDDERSDGSFFDAPALETNRFGKRIDKDRWIFERKALMGYYEEMMANPARLVTLYKSFRPDRKDGEVAGFQFKTEGEGDFFKAVGFQDGDVVRTVNSMQMTSQRRAEFFMGEFVRENLNAIVIEVEREGEMRNLIYLIR
jgi:hypothetical protein